MVSVLAVHVTVMVELVAVRERPLGLMGILEKAGENVPKMMIMVSKMIFFIAIRFRNINGERDRTCMDTDTNNSV